MLRAAADARSERSPITICSWPISWRKGRRQGTSCTAMTGSSRRGSPMRDFSGTRTARHGSSGLCRSSTNHLPCQARAARGNGSRRIEALAGDIARTHRRRSGEGAPCRRASAKADLVTGMVGEFPELQGLMGSLLCDGAEGSMRRSPMRMRDHYKPQGPSDIVPQAHRWPMAVALADKLDTLIGFWVIDEKPTGSKDPLRAAPGGARRHPPGSRAMAAEPAFAMLIA